MGFLATTWWIWIIAAMLCFLYIVVGQIIKMKKFFNSDFNDGSFSGFFNNMLWMIIVGAAGWVCAILFVIGVIAAFVLR